MRQNKKRNKKQQAKYNKLVKTEKEITLIEKIETQNIKEGQ